LSEPIANRVGMSDEEPHTLWMYCTPRDSDEPKFLVVFDDADREPIAITEEGAARKAFHRFEQNWNCHLFQLAKRERSSEQEIETPHDMTNAYLWNQWKATVMVLGAGAPLMDAVRTFANRILMRFGNAAGMYRAMSENFESEQQRKSMHARLYGPVGTTDLEQWLNTITPADWTALHRFRECLEDAEGYDVPVAQIEHLAELGLLKKVRGSVYEFTQIGLAVQDRAAHVTSRARAGVQ